MASLSAREQLQALVSRPPVLRGWQTLDRSLFERQLELLAVSVPSSRVTEALKVVKEHFLRQPGLSSFADDEQDKTRRLLILTEDDPRRLPERLRLKFSAEDWPLRRHLLRIGYDFWSASDIFRSVLPEELVDEAPSSFARVGHIAHLNLREEYLPYKELIGQVILEKNPGIHTVVNKLDTIDNEFRFFKMEVLAGEPDFIAELNEGGCRFRFDFSKVYWNTRLSTEHARLVDTFKPTDVICDAFAGVGPFALPAAKKGCVVLANDLNPESAKALRENIALNKLEDRVRAFQEDARTFIQRSAVELWEEPLPAAGPRLSNAQRKAQARAGRPSEPEGPPSRLIDHFVMNLPDTALTFLSSFRGMYASLAEKDGFEAAARARGLPMVHCYCFAVAETDDEAQKQICERASQSLGHPVSDTLLDFAISYVRNVSPKKNMWRLDFRLPWEVLVACS